MSIQEQLIEKFGIENITSISLKAGIAPETLRRFINGKGDISIGNLIKVLKVLNITVLKID